MADLSRWQSGREGRRDLENWVNSLWSGFGNLPEQLTYGTWPKTDIYEDTEGLTLHFEVPGLDPNNVRVQLNENTLTVSGERKLDNEDKKNNYHRIERSYGAFERSFTLPHNLDTEKTKADYKNGVLSVWLPKSERAKPRSIQVKVDSK